METSHAARSWPSCVWGGRLNRPPPSESIPVAYPSAYSISVLGVLLDAGGIFLEMVCRERLLASPRASCLQADSPAIDVSIPRKEGYDAQANQPRAELDLQHSEELWLCEADRV